MSETPSNPNIDFTPKYHANVNEKRPSSYSEYKNFNIEWSPQDNYEIVRKIGKGKYSEVFQGINTANNKFCAIKILKPVRKTKINREIKILQNLSGGPNIVQLLDVCLDPSAQVPSLVFDYIENTYFRQLYKNFSDFEMRSYLYKLLTAIDYTHNNGIMHRDIKPNNVIFDPLKDDLRLIDWGLADFYHPGVEYNVRVCTLYFKPPELLLNYQKYHYSIDMWSFGCVMAGMMFDREPFFRGKNNDDQLDCITRVLGGRSLSSYCQRVGIELKGSVEHASSRCIKLGFERLCNRYSNSKISSEGVDLIEKLLVMDHSKRLYAHEAMAHAFFDPVRPKFK